MSEQTFIYKVWTNILECNRQIQVEKVEAVKTDIGYRIMDKPSRFLTGLGFEELTTIFTSTVNNENDRFYLVYSYADSPDKLKVALEKMREHLAGLKAYRESRMEYENLIDKGLDAIVGNDEVTYNCNLYDTYSVGDIYILFEKYYICVGLSNGLAFFAEVHRERATITEADFSKLIALDINSYVTPITIKSFVRRK